MADNLKGIPFSSDDEGTDHIQRARQLVVNKYNQRKMDYEPKLELVETYVVIFAYVLGGWKALISTSRPDGVYYELTYNKPKAETYVDTYLKVDNEAVAD